MKEGLFIVFDGPEGAGKSTQLKLLAQSFQKVGYEVVETLEPGGTEVGQEMRKLLLHSKYPLLPETEVLLFSAARAQIVKEVIRPAINSGKIVICDRFVAATYAYQGVAGKVELDKIDFIVEWICGQCFPDLTLILSVPPEVGFRRKEQGTLDRIECKSPEYHEKVLQGFVDYYNLNKVDTRLLNLSAGVAETHSIVLRIIEDQFGISLPAAI